MRRPRIKNGSRSRRIATAALTTLLICAVAAGAYWLLLPSGHGSSSPTAIGKAPAAAEYVLEPSFTAGSLKPGAGVPLTVKATNTTGSASDIKKLKTAIAVDAEHAAAGCQAAWFSVNYGTLGTELEGSGAKTPIAVATGTSNLTTALNEPVVRMAEESSVNQSSCLSAAEGGVGAESAKLTVTLNATP